MDIKTTLAPRHGFDPRDPEALSMWNTAIQAVMFAKMIGAMHTFFVWVSLITLALGGIGVMNIMLVAVKERTREIGVRKAIGATSRAIQWQFLSEGLALTLSSGALGYLVGVGLCALVNLAPMPERFSGMITTWQTAAMAIGVADVHRRRGLDVPGAPRGVAAADRGAAVRDVIGGARVFPPSRKRFGETGRPARVPCS